LRKKEYEPITSIAGKPEFVSLLDFKKIALKNQEFTII